MTEEDEPLILAAGIVFYEPRQFLRIMEHVHVEHYRVVRVDWFAAGSITRNVTVSKLAAVLQEEIIVT